MDQAVLPLADAVLSSVSDGASSPNHSELQAQAASVCTPVYKGVPVYKRVPLEDIESAEALPAAHNTARSRRANLPSRVPEGPVPTGYKVRASASTGSSSLRDGVTRVVVFVESPWSHLFTFGWSLTILGLWALLAPTWWSSKYLDRLALGPQYLNLLWRFIRNLWQIIRDLPMQLRILWEIGVAVWATVSQWFRRRWGPRATGEKTAVRCRKTGPAEM
jgi:hypothetical protein